MRNSGQRPDPSAHAETFDRIRVVRNEDSNTPRIAQGLFLRRRALLRQLVEAGFSHADIARELGVSRQAIQKMLA